MLGILTISWSTFKLKQLAGTPWPCA